jgi:hypothetical protein
MTTRQADDYGAIRAAMRTPWMPKKEGTQYNHCDHCPKEPQQQCMILCAPELERQRKAEVKS